MTNLCWKDVPATSSGVALDFDDMEVKRFPNLSLTIPRVRTPLRFGRVGTIVVTKKRLLFLMYGYSYAYSLLFLDVTRIYPAEYPGRSHLGWLDCTTKVEPFSIQGPRADIEGLKTAMPEPGSPARRVLISSGALRTDGGAPTIGVGAVIRENEKKSNQRGKVISDVTTLDDLRRSASDLVDIANLLAKTTDLESGRELSEISAQIGLKKKQGNEPMRRTAGTAGLAEEFADDMARFFQIQQQKILSLPEAFALYNRLRADALMPKEIAKAVATSQREDSFPVRIEKLGKVTYVVTKDASFEQTVKTLVAELKDSQPITALAFGKRCGIPASMAKDYLLRAEAQGLVARDDSLRGLYFYKNLFPRFAAGLEAKK
jgi:hypothetical protein